MRHRDTKRGLHHRAFFPKYRMLENLPEIETLFLRSYNRRWRRSFDESKRTTEEDDCTVNSIQSLITYRIFQFQQDLTNRITM